MGLCAAVLFDWDGVLVNFLDTKRAHVGLLFSTAFGADPSVAEQTYQQYAGIGRRRIFDIVAQRTIGRTLGEQEYSVLSERFDELNEGYLTRDKLYPGAEHAMIAQREAGRQVHISCSVPMHTLLPLVDRFGLLPYADEVLGTDYEGGKGEGHCRYLGRKYGLTPEQIRGVFDSVQDVLMHRAAGVRVIGIPNTTSASALHEAGADKVIPSLWQLEDVLREE